MMHWRQQWRVDPAVRLYRAAVKHRPVECHLGDVANETPVAMRPVIKYRPEGSRWIETSVGVFLTFFGWSIITGLCVAVALAISMALARGHDWYPAACCSDRDCAPISAERVRAVMIGGYLIDGSIYVGSAEVQPSPDGLIHACFSSENKLRCLFMPPPDGV